MQQQELVTILVLPKICSSCQKPSKRIRKSMCGTCYKRVYRRENIRSTIAKKVYDCTYKARYSRLKNSSKKRNLICTLTLEEFSQITAWPCYYCDGRLGETGSGLDRADNTKGYTLENSLPCCDFCNSIKSDLLTANETLVAIAAIKLYQAGKLFHSSKLSSKTTRLIVSVCTGKLRKEKTTEQSFYDTSSQARQRVRKKI